MSATPSDLPVVDLALRNLLAWSLQLGLVALTAAVVTRLVPIERPGLRLALWQVLLVLALVLPLLQPWGSASVGGNRSFGLATADSAHGGTVPGPALVAAPGLGWGLLLAMALGAGIALQLGRLLTGLVRLTAIRRAARPLDVPACLERVRAGLAPRARFVTSDDCGGPATFGVLRPTIVLPLAICSMPSERLQAVALHELVHARRGDWVAHVAEELLKAVLFFHPAIHWLVGRTRLAREQCVDAAVVRLLEDRHAYLESLLEVARLTARDGAVPAAPFLRERHLRERVELLLRGIAVSREQTLARLTLITLALALAGAWAVSAFPLHQLGSHKHPRRVAKANTPVSAAPTSAAVGSPATAAGGLAGNGVKPRLVHKVDPLYPKDVSAEGIRGTYLIQVTIHSTGRIATAHVVASAPSYERATELMVERGRANALEGDERLAAAALEAVRQWRYEPILGKNGSPRTIEGFIVTVRFVLT